MLRVHSFDSRGAVSEMTIPRVLYRFVRDDEFLEATLSAPYLWFSDLRSFNDPMESESRIDLDIDSQDFCWWLEKYAGGKDGSIASLWGEVKRRPDVLEQLRPEIEQASRQAFLRKLDQAAVCCFSETGGASLMWSHYADSHRGACIVVQVPSLLTDRRFAIQAVDYVDDLRRWNIARERRLYGTTDEFDVRFDQAVLASKTREWSYEREYRLIAHSRGRVDVPESAVVGFITGVRMSDARHDYLSDLIVGRYGPNKVRVLRASMDSRTGKMNPELNAQQTLTFPARGVHLGP